MPDGSIFSAARAGQVSSLSSEPTSKYVSASLFPLPASARLSLRFRTNDAAAIDAAAALGIGAPVNTCVASSDRTIARLGPDEWLLLCSEAMGATVRREVDTALAGRAYSLVDIGHRNVAISVEGGHARSILNAGCPLDLRERSFPPGSATRTLLGKAEIILLRPNIDPVYRVECWRSFAPYVHTFLRDAARELERTLGWAASTDLNP